jgi:hypothetical protein
MGRLACPPLVAAQCQNDGAITQRLEKDYLPAQCTPGSRIDRDCNGIFREVLPHFGSSLLLVTWQLVFYGPGYLWKAMVDPLRITTAVPERGGGSGTAWLRQAKDSVHTTLGSAGKQCYYCSIPFMKQ